MKKLLMVLLLVSIVMGTAFAQEGWGIGGVGTFGGNFNNSAEPYAGGYVTLKAPQSPIYWGISLRTIGNTLILGLQGDSYLIQNTLVPDVGLGLYVGVGLYGTIILNDPLGLGFGARVPIGLSLRIPSLEILEFFLEIAPTAGLGMVLGNDIDFDFDAGWIGGLGFRVWF